MAILASLPSASPCSSTLITLNSIPSLKPLSTKSGRYHNETTTLTSTAQGTPQDEASRSGDKAHGSPPSEAGCDPSPPGEDPNDMPQPEDPHNLIRRFSLYGKAKSILEVNEAIKRELLKCHPATQGCIYGFLHPGNVRVKIGTGPCSNIQIIKIGRSMDLNRRMKEWKEKCKYEPLVVLNANMPHHRRVERIVHQQLHNSRLKEYPGCSGCNLQHNEWFRVSTLYAGHLVTMWQDFANRQPYGEDGNLLPCWLQRLEQIDLEDPGCWMWFILGNPLIRTLSSVVNDEDNLQLKGPSILSP